LREKARTYKRERVQKVKEKEKKERERSFTKAIVVGIKRERE
jgi:hypothetical protein